ncbi:MAG TPA: TonB-dependent receptor [Eoetvoesiella sp.]
MNLKLSRHALAVISCFAPFAVTAQTTSPVPQLENVVVTASRSAQLQSKVLGDVTVIDKKELEQAGQSSVAEVLSRHHGIEFATNGGPQTTTSVFLRGANANHTLVLVDGIPVNSATTGTGALNAIPTASIERIEVLRGSASSLYGANAIGGVINIITNQSSDKPFSAHASTGYGTYGTSKSSAGIAGSADGWTYSLGSSYEQSRGFNATDGALSYANNDDKDSYYSRNLRGSLGYEWQEGQKLSVQAYNSRINGGYDNAQADAFNDRAIQTQEIYSVASENQLADYWKSTLRYAYTDDKYKDISLFGDSTTRSQQHQYTWQNDFTLSDTQKVVVAYEHLNQRVSTDPFATYTHAKRHNNAFTGVYTGDFGSHHLQASARNDHDSQFGDATTGGLSYGYDLTSKLRGYVAANTGFKTPTFSDLYAPASWGANPDLKPEKSRNVEVGLRYTDDSTSLGVVAYQNKVRDLIAFDSPTFTAQNVDRATLRGITLTAQQRLGDTTLNASADFQDPHNDATGNQLARRAKQIYRLSADHRIKEWTLGTEYMFTGKRYDDPQNTRRLGGYSLWNLTASYDVTKSVAVQLRWNNVLDKDYNTAYGYNMPGSNVFVNVAWRM